MFRTLRGNPLAEGLVTLRPQPFLLKQDLPELCVLRPARSSPFDFEGKYNSGEKAKTKEEVSNVLPVNFTRKLWTLRAPPRTSS